MGYVEELLASNEKIVYRTRKHWIAPLLGTVTGTALTVGGIVALIMQFAADGFWQGLLLWGGLLALLIGLALLAKSFIEWWSEEYVVTNHKVMKVSGILRKTADGSALEKINDITISQSLLGRALDYGTVVVQTATDESNLNYTAMREPVDFRKEILDQKQAFEQGDARAIAEAVRQAPQFSAPAVPAEPAAPTAEEITATIERLAGLRSSGAITAEEFEAKKAELLKRL
jgi:uncharacterized membrane protein YdbT with pleckstrin-like domain